MLVAPTRVSAQIVIKGNVYGGGYAGNLGGKTEVSVYSGSIHHVFGGACRADVAGSSFVHIDGEHASNYIIIDKVYGGNDIAGTIGTSAEVPAALTQSAANSVDNTWNTFVRVSTKTVTTGEGDAKVTTAADDAQSVFMGQLFAGGNGDYDYSAKKPNGKYDVTIDEETVEDVVKPEVSKAYLEVLGGTIGYTYGGGNNVTVSEKTVINIDNISEIVSTIKDTRVESAGEGELINDTRCRELMGLNLAHTNPRAGNFQFDRVFGGNNKAEMHIRPTWNLKDGKIHNLYSGGNQGAMTSPEGLLLEIKEDSKILVDNLYGGCRMADVRPTVDGVYTPVGNLPGYKFPSELSARVLVRGGDINNVYGGNDITGRVYGGGAIGIYTSVRGDVYGGGNGSYAYTDNTRLANDETYGDFYYDPGANSAEALNNFRPNAEQVSIRLHSPSEEKPTIIGGGVFCGGNSASLKTTKLEPMVELKIGSNVIADYVFLGNNGRNMIRYNEENKTDAGEDDEGALEGVLRTMSRTDIPALEGTKFNSINLLDADEFATYMQGAAMPLIPNVVFDSMAKGDPADYEPFSTYIGSFFLGGNVGSMTAPGTFTMDELNSIIIYNKVVGGCNDAYVAASTYNAEHMGGVTTAPAAGSSKIRMNFEGLRLKPMKLVGGALEWNTNGEDGDARRLIGGNIYGGCYRSGYVNGGIVINLDQSTVNKAEVFGTGEGESNVNPELQRDELRFTSMGIFGGGYGVNSEVWGSTEINVRNGYHFLVYGGGEQGVVGKKDAGIYTYNADYSTHVNLVGSVKGAETGDMAEAEYLYGGGFEGLVAGDAHVNLGNGRINSSFGGACNADILGHSETIIGTGGFPYVIDDVYGGNDLGGNILGSADLKTKVREAIRSQMFNSGSAATASSYVEYLQGHVGEIFGGAYGGYKYETIPENTKVLAHLLDGTDTKEVNKPYLNNAFVHVRPERNNDSRVNAVYGAGLGSSNEFTEAHLGDVLQDRSYVLIDIPENYDKLRDLKVFGAGSYNGLGMRITRSASDADPESASAIIDLMCGEVDQVFGASYNEGITRRTLVNVPDGSTIKLNSIFGGAYGTRSENDWPCDAFEANVNYASNDAIVRHAIYGGNNNARRTFYGKVTVSSNVWSDKEKGYQATVYGAGYGRSTWSQYTEVNLESGANVYEAYGGGEMGLVINKETVAKWKTSKTDLYVDLPDGYTDNGLSDALALSNRLYERDSSRPEKYNTNVHIKQGAYVGGYCYGGGLGYNSEANSGNVYGTTYIDLLGGAVKKDLYAAGTTGSVKDSLDIGGGFIASSTAYIEGGTVRNVYGGGWKGSVGHHIGGIDASTEGDILGETHVIIGIREDQATPPVGYGYYVGVPAVQRNVYGGGEGGAVYGTSHVTLNNGYIGYVYSTTEPTAPDGITENPPYEESPYESGTYYQEKIHDETWTDHVGENRLYGSGNVFGGGYIDNSSVDFSNIIMWNGKVRNSLFGGGEIAAIGRGAVEVTGYQNSERTLLGKYKLGKTHIEMYNGHVLRDVFAGGKGYDNLGRVGTLYTDGYVFGQTEAFIRGGEVGTATNYTEGYGNVFGGGDLGYVYGIGTKSTKETGTAPGRCYYTIDGTEGGAFTEDCKVVVEPYAQVKAAGSVTIADSTFLQYQYVPVEYLNKLKGKNDINDGAKWDALDVDDRGVVIHNAVFGGGNVADGSDKVYANTRTVFGNVTAALRDVACRDLITIGTEHVGGLYGGGNLSLVDGYRELHISNYGTDYYGLTSEIDMDEYNSLTDRERAYFRLRYTCQKTFSGGTYDGVSYKGHTKDEQIFEDEFNELPPEYQTAEYWTQDGVCSIYAGRLLNTLQRADLVGVIGSRMVLQGARDRVTEVQDKTNFTINRVGELSLEKVTAPTGDIHGNYFGIYSVVNYLGNLTSDVLMTDTRVTDSGDADGSTSYHDWKAAHPNSRKRNTATCHNQVALASGVFLELTTEYSGTPGKKEKEYGYITGVVELDLINAKADAIGGGYVYAKNEHGTRRNIPYTMIRLSEYNRAYNLRTYRMYEYDDSPASNLEVIQTSGNFIHGKAKTIIDDCYPHNLEYDPADAENFSDAHYWYIKGSIYIYDQVISAYTGAPTAYIKEKHIPLTITAGSHGALKLIDIKPNKYAYWADSGHSAQIDPDGDGIRVANNSVTYKLNDVITYWDWSQLPADEQALFVDQTYVNIETGEVRLDDDGGNADVHLSNNISHDTGYVLDFKMNTPPAWNTWYSEKEGSGAKIDTPTYGGKTSGEQEAYMPGPTYSTSLTGVYGQRNYHEGEIVTKDVVDQYSNPGTSDQAVVERAYVAKEAVTYTYDSVEKSVNKGTAIPKTEYDALPSATQAKFGEAKMCISTLRLNEETFMVYGDLLTPDVISDLKTGFSDYSSAIDESLIDAYVCKTAGKYGGKSYSDGKKYSAIEGWASLTAEDRASNKFSFNYDGLDVLIDPTYSGDMAASYRSPYSDLQHVEYVAIYNSDTPLDASAEGLGTINKNDELSRTNYETLTNEKYHYTPIVVSNTSPSGEDIYIAKTAFTRGSMAYAQGQVIPSSTYRALSESERTSWAEIVRITNESSTPVTYFYCREAYTGQTSVTNRKDAVGVINDATVNGSGTSVGAGWVITKTDYDNLVNHQKNFIIKGEEPTETTTLYVSRESNIQDLSKDKVISVIYQYTYNESDDSGENVNLVNEMHIVNIHLEFESGAPIIDRLMAPTTVLPGTTVGMNQPRVTPGAYELIGGGWEIFDNQTDAELHRNGKEYVNNATPMYYYQDGYYVAYYAKSYLGKTYSNPVQFSVANYHDLKAVMDATEHHYYIDHSDAHKLGKRIPKVYINDYTADSANGLDLLKGLYDLTCSKSAAVTAYGALDTPENIRGANDLDFILRTNLAVGSTPWTPIGSGEATCFGGNVHGDGHYVSGLTGSLFDRLCGKVYNLGVQGAFISGGIANSGEGTVENCWVKDTTGVEITNPIIGISSPASGQIQNSYYLSAGAADTPGGSRVAATAQQFYNGEVAYNLNRFFLQERFDRNKPGGQAAIDDTYVQDRYGNVDFIYANGEIPEDDDVRLDSETGNYVPLYPDDYIFFGQALNYGYVYDAVHQDVPSPIVKDADGNYVETNTAGNRVLRAPAYFRSSTMSKAYFNPYAVFAKHKNGDENTLVQDGMTAIDFTGYNDTFNGSTGTAKPYVNGIDANNNFFTPLLDAETALTNFKNFGLTKNLLAYTEAPETGDEATVAGKTGHAVSLALEEMRYAETDGTYGTVADKDESQVMGHWVQRNEGLLTYKATYDHFLVDRNDFHAPIGYTFDGSSRMWHQRTPDNYVDLTKGWEAVSLPFEINSVHTQTKGQLTHFYRVTSGSAAEKDKGRIGHEYWLRGYEGIENDGDIYKADFKSMEKSGNDDYVVTNTFLWDYYHNTNAARSQEGNSYYSDERNYRGYPYPEAATPYIIGFPGTRYYEFDLSGEWSTSHVNEPRPMRLPQQIITFVSPTGQEIEASDAATGVTRNGYTFKPNYLNNTLSEGYVLKADGSGYERVTGTKDVEAFRPYFVGEYNQNAKEILFTETDGKMEATPNVDKDNEPSTITERGVKGITFTPGIGTITATSTLDEPRVVLVYGVSGALVKAFDLKQNSSVTVHVPSGLVYAVRTVSGDYSSKLFVR
ncbi:MAG: hypothetical protein J5905_04255 [Prevotella sp.]|nr:hypothetical protein [Prevotella sp.]MBO5613701.1 hypothetical protein [Prevotella sp.]